MFIVLMCVISSSTTHSSNNPPPSSSYSLAIQLCFAKNVLFDRHKRTRMMSSTSEIENCLAKIYDYDAEDKFDILDWKKEVDRR